MSDEREKVPCIRCGIPRHPGGKTRMCNDCVGVDPKFGQGRRK